MAKILRSNQQELPPSKESIWGMALGISSLFRMWLALPLGITGLVTSILSIIGGIIIILIYGAIIAGLLTSSPEDFFNVAY